PTPEPPPTTPATTGLPDELDTSLIGLQGHFVIPDQQDMLLDMSAYDLKVGWVKQQVDWAVIEYIPGDYTVYLGALDGFVNGAFDRNMNVLLSFAHAPDWARTTTDQDGPPTNYEDYYRFVTFILNRYKGKVQAVEVWNEPNLRREWVGAELNGASYVELLAGAYPVIKAVDPSIVVVSAGLAPTGVTSDLAVDDRLYFRQMYEAGVQQHADAIGIHPYGWANPPEVLCCGQPGSGPSHNDHPSFFFLDTIQDYRAIQAEFGDSERPLWATEFGWGTMQSLGLEVPAEQPFFQHVNEQQQAMYIVDAFRLAQTLDYMGPMFLWNLNVATLDGFDPNQAGYSILRDELDRPRPAYEQLRDYPRSTE
ncbi:MAG: cellulase family glycosylhydrolase, partial [Chloroflexi bacterium]|nr:cellulase family glycosylhydrolase [Chloroflexota bacterium]